MSFHVTCEIEFLTFNFMDENKKAAKGAPQWLNGN